MLSLFDNRLKTVFTSALRNPPQAGLAYNSCATTVARVRLTSNSAFPSRPCARVVFMAYRDLAVFSTTTSTCL